MQLLSYIYLSFCKYENADRNTVQEKKSSSGAEIRIQGFLTQKSVLLGTQKKIRMDPGGVREKKREVNNLS